MFLSSHIKKKRHKFRKIGLFPFLDGRVRKYVICWVLQTELFAITYEGWNFNFGNTPLDWIQELLE